MNIILLQVVSCVYTIQNITVGTYIWINNDEKISNIFILRFLLRTVCYCIYNKKL